MTQKNLTALTGSTQTQPEASLIASGVDKNALAIPEVIIVGKEPVTTSQSIARYFGRDHDKIVKRIENLDCSDDFLTRNFRC